MEQKQSVKTGLFLFGIAILIAGLWYWTKPEKATEINSEIILFYGRECPHCRDVDKFLEEIGGERETVEELSIQKKDLTGDEMKVVVMKPL